MCVVWRCLSISLQVLNRSLSVVSIRFLEVLKLQKTSKIRLIHSGNPMSTVIMVSVKTLLIITRQSKSTREARANNKKEGDVP